ncbi:hypothetical protein [Granulicatella sp.]
MNRIKTFSKSIKQPESITETTLSRIHSIENELDFADKYAEEHSTRYSHKEIFTRVKERINKNIPS